MIPRYVIIMRFRVISQTDLFPEDLWMVRPRRPGEAVAPRCLTYCSRYT